MTKNERLKLIRKALAKARNGTRRPDGKLKDATLAVECSRLLSALRAGDTKQVESYARSIVAG